MNDTPPKYFDELISIRDKAQLDLEDAIAKKFLFGTEVSFWAIAEERRIVLKIDGEDVYVSPDSISVPPKKVLFTSLVLKGDRKE